MDHFDVIVVGSGAGRYVVRRMVRDGKKAALVDHGPIGGTCLNRGCLPSKMVIYPADLIQLVREANKVNLSLEVLGVDFPSLMERTQEYIDNSVQFIKKRIAETENYDWIKGTGKFIDRSTLKVNNRELTAQNIVLANGARPNIPEINGLEEVEYITNRTVFNLRELPKSMIIVGGGYIAVEFAHFFDAIGTEVTLLGKSPYLVKKEDKDVSELLKKELSKRMNIVTNIEAQRVNQKGSLITINARDSHSNTEHFFEAESLFIATGRRPNSDLLQVENADLEVEKNGFVKVDEYLRTSQKGIWALGDINGKYMYRHVANDEARIVYNNIKRLERKEELLPMDYSAIPYAIFTQPQIATVGMTLEKAVETGRKLLVGKLEYDDVFKGTVMGYPSGFCRIIVDEETKRILGSTIVGPYAPILLQSIVNVMNCEEGTYMPLIRAIYIHPEVTELIRSTIGALKPYRRA